MMNSLQNVTLKAQSRDVKEKPKKLLRNGFIPAILYGPKTPNQTLVISEKDFSKILRNKQASFMISLSLGDKESFNVIIKNLQTDPVTDEVIHIDFQKISMDKEITTTVPVDFEGISPAVKDQGGVLVKSVDKLEISCLPGNIPESIKVDISQLKTFEDVIKISDLNISDTVKLDLGPEDIIAVVTPPRSEAEIEALDEDVVEDVEAVEGVKKEEPEEVPEGEEASQEDKEDKKEETKKEK